MPVPPSPGRRAHRRGMLVAPFDVELVGELVLASGDGHAITAISSTATIAASAPTVLPCLHTGVRMREWMRTAVWVLAWLGVSVGLLFLAGTVVAELLESMGPT